VSGERSELPQPHKLSRTINLNRSKVATAALWCGIFAPVAINEVRTRSSLLSSLLDPASLAKGVIPLICLVLAVTIYPTSVFPIGRLEKLLATYLTITLLSTLWSQYPAASLLKSLNLISVYFLILVLSRVHQRDDVESQSQLIPIIYGILVSALVCLLIFPGKAYQQVGVYESTKRLFGVFPFADPDALAFLGSVAIIAQVVHVSRNRIGILLSVLAILISSVDLILTKTRSALALLICGIAAVMVDRRRYRSGLALVLTVAFFAWLALLGPPSVRNLIGRAQPSSVIGTLTGRTVTWSDALRQWEQRPLTGFGYYAGHRLALESHPGAPELSNLDDMWIETLLDVGLLGLIPLLASVGYGAYLLFVHPLPELTLEQRALRRSLFIVCFLASAISPSLQSVDYVMIVFAIVLLGNTLLEEPLGRRHAMSDSVAAPRAGGS
jgi:O-antigen ligase